MNEMMSFVALGLAAGALSGLIGIGGGVIIVPALVFLFNFSQHRAEGTTLALLIPPGRPARHDALLSQRLRRSAHRGARRARLPFWGWGGGHFANVLPAATLQRLSGAVLLALKMLWGR